VLTSTLCIHIIVGRRVAYLNRRSEEENVQSALLEYGEFYQPPQKPQTESKQHEMAKQLEKTLGRNQSREAIDSDEEARRRNAELQKDMKEAGAIKIDSSLLGSLLESNIDEVSEEKSSGKMELLLFLLFFNFQNKMQSQYEADQASMDGEGAQRRFGAKMHEQKISRLERDIEQAKR
jgi:hypothetical protein